MRRPPLLVLAVAAVTTTLFALPFVGLLLQADWAHLGRDLSTPEAQRALRLSLVASLQATVAVVVLGLPLAWVLARWRFPGRAIVRSLVLLPMVLPPVVGGIALLSVFSRNRPVGRFFDSVFGIQFTFTRWGVVLATTFVALPFFVLTVEAALANLDRRYEQVAEGLGAGPFTAFRLVTLPMIGPSVLAGAVLAWARALGEFGATITFAGNIEGRTRTLPLAVYLKLDNARSTAIALSLVLLAVSFVVLVALRNRLVARA